MSAYLDPDVHPLLEHQPESQDCPACDWTNDFCPYHRGRAEGCGDVADAVDGHDYAIDFIGRLLDQQRRLVDDTPQNHPSWNDYRARHTVLIWAYDGLIEQSADLYGATGRNGHGPSTLDR